MTDQQPEALDLANWLDAVGNGGISSTAAAAELRRLHARIAEIEAQLEAIGAGGVSGPLMGRASLAANAGSEPVARVNDDGFIVEIGDLLIAPGQKLYLHPSPPEGMVGGWISVDERLPAPDKPVLACNGKWTGVAAWMSGDYLEPRERWQDEHREFIEMMGPAVTHWMPMPPPPSSAKGVAHG